jgi:DNA-binding MarR family transcriptional regulator
VQVTSQSQNPIELRFSLHLLRCATVFHSHVEQRFRKEFETTTARFEVLTELSREPMGVRSSELSKRLLVSAGNITQIINHLIHDGYVTRTASPTDGRAQLIYLSPKGAKAVEKMMRSYTEWLAELFGQLSQQELAEFADRLGRLEHYLLNAALA